MSLFRNLMIVLVAFIGLALAAPVTLRQCGSAYYASTDYICYHANGGLCPIMNGEPTLLCGAACYSPYKYQCVNGALYELPFESGVFTLTANNSEASFNGQPIQAQGEQFYVGGSPGTYCPAYVEEVDGSCPSGNTTVFGVGYLSVSVPGGQSTYWQTNGALAFSQVHSFGMFNESARNSTVYRNGDYYGPNGEGLLACPVNASNANWQVFARLTGVEFSSDCVDFFAITHGLPTDTKGAYEYV